MMRTKNRRRRKRQTAYYVYAKANQMKDHKFNDDVALVKATSCYEAYKKFCRYYGNCTLDDVFPLRTKGDDADNVMILTDY